jgi:hypothetical protein
MTGRGGVEPRRRTRVEPVAAAQVVDGVAGAARLHAVAVALQHDGIRGDVLEDVADDLVLVAAR